MSRIAEVLYSREEIQERVAELGRRITEDYRGHAPVLVSVLKGSVMFLSDLLREIRLPVRMDFMSISAYGPSAEKGGVVRILKDLDQDIGGQHVLLVEDIVDTGLTATYLMRALAARRPESLGIVALLDKSVRRITPLEVAYAGFDCPDRFVVGYGMDHSELYRNLPYIAAVTDMDALTADPSALEGAVTLVDPIR
jgi:hypoxanthine phosphoribosyltransferase